MGRTPSSSPTGIYAKLVGLYPKSYRQRYGQPMVQTFDDMLEAEPSTARRAVIWARALIDLPSSVLKEHVTNGRGITMNRNTKIIITVAAFVLIFANGASFWFGNLHARQAVGIERVSPTQLADAMLHDSFYSHYGDAALLFSGKVINVQQKNTVTIATFETNSAYALECQFSGVGQIKLGDTMSIAAPGGSAERLPHGVLLHNCLKN